VDVNPGISLPDTANLYITSYSEGGSYALWASKLITQDGYGDILTTSGFKLRRTAGISGAYDLSGATSRFFTDNADNSWNPALNVWNVSPGMFESGIPGAIPASAYPLLRSLSYLNLAGGKALFAPYLLTALTYYVTSQAVFDVITTPSFAQMNWCLNLNTYISSETTTPAQNVIPCSTLIQGPSLILPQLFNTVGINSQQIFNQVFGAALNTGYVVGTNTFNQLIVSMQTPATSNNNTGGGNNSISLFLNKGIAYDPSVQPYLQQQDIAGGWTPSSPLEIIYLRYDSFLTNINSQEACGLVPTFNNSIKTSAPKLVNCTVVDNASPTPGSGLYQQTSGAPLFLDHGWAEPVLQMIALRKFIDNP
jgi:hypothetical protein